jgi:hypothetical protein
VSDGADACSSDLGLAERNRRDEREIAAPHEKLLSNVERLG